MLLGYVKEVNDKLKVPTYLYPNVILWYKIEQKPESNIYGKWFKNNYTILESGSFRKDNYQEYSFPIFYNKTQNIKDLNITEDIIESIFWRVYDRSKILKTKFSNNFILNKDSIKIDVIDLSIANPNIYRYEIEAVYNAEFLQNNSKLNAKILLEFNLMITKYQLQQIFEWRNKIK